MRVNKSVEILEGLEGIWSKEEIGIYKGTIQLQIQKARRRIADLLKRVGKNGFSLDECMKADSELVRLSGKVESFKLTDEEYGFINNWYKD